MEATLSSATARGCWNQARPSAEPLLLRRVEAGDRNPCLLSIARPNKFVQLSLTRTGYRSTNNLLFKVLSAEKEQVHVVEGRSVDELYDALVSRLLPPVSVSSSPNHKLLVGLAGPPGAGKSTLAHEVAKRINKLWPEKASSFDSQIQPPDVAVVVPMDGFHLYRSELDAMEDPEEAHARRGAPWTFNPLRLLTCLKNLRINVRHKVVIVEGNYLLLEDGGWKEISSLFDEKWFIDIDIDKAMQRVLKRHISTGKPPDIAKQRIENNDRLNAELIIKSKKNADILIKSVDF
ncbi:ATP-dependent kinase YFH7 isoform X2 [Abrus precatorius]|uniref:ATP-dependent kinase YFH7 isoform X2 n=1 Tax=Abrus precatorius TaxID=3816 RepID=A0A8B8L7M5_ABRPR|nr:ATP-dependent kinase YFH7 isoform X2 [Abrus precatorius]